ncbi:MAG: DUF2141 domain-containing protein [Chlorobi bacterium]|nr:DUF2141 domain-containing protein [Chlorobiota bacterium]
MKKILGISILMFFGMFVSAQSGTIKVVIPKIQSDKGNIKVALYNKEGSDGFLKDLNSAYKKKQVEIKNNSAVIILNIPYGTYAVSLFQDENNNSIIDRAAIGFPVEPYGISGNKNTIGPPKFDDAKFSFNKPYLRLNIILKTYIKRNF